MTDFATPKAAIKAGFARIEAGMKLGFWRRTQLFANFERAHLNGNHEFSTVLKTLQGSGWRWPWFETFAAVFSEMAFWPQSWMDFEMAPPLPWDVMPDEMKCALLAQTLTVAIYMERDIVNLRSAVQTTGVKLTLAPGLSECKAEAHFIKLNKQKIERGNYKSLPPYFPGDTTRIRIKS